MKNKRRVRLRVIRSMFPTSESIAQENIGRAMEIKSTRLKKIEKSKMKIDSSLHYLSLIKNEKEKHV